VICISVEITTALVIGVAMFVVALITLVVKLIELSRR
jgi:multisubunit Na+/H+ antiporter MnhC subunit